MSWLFVGSTITGTAPLSIDGPQVVTGKRGNDRLKWS